MNEAIKKIIAERDFSRLEDIWLEMMQKPETNPRDFFTIAAGLKNAQFADRAYPLLDILASHWEAAGELRKAIETYKHMTYYTADHQKIREKLLTLYRKLYPENHRLEEFLRCAQLAAAEPVTKAVDRLEEFLQFDIGRYFYYEHYGVGSVFEVVPARREIVLSFEKEKRQQLTIDLAKKILTPLSEDHFLYQKSTAITQLQEMAVRDPHRLVRLIVRSFTQPLTAAQIKDYCTGIVNPDDWNAWWNKQKKSLENDPQIRIGGTNRKTYEYVAVGVDRTGEALRAFETADPKEKYRLAEEYARKQPGVFAQLRPQLVKLGTRAYRGNPGLALDILLLCQDEQCPEEFSYTVDTLLSGFPVDQIARGLQNPQHHRFLLATIRTQDPAAWPAAFKKIFFAVDDASLFDELKAALESRPAVLKDIYQDIFLLARNHPRHYQWFLKNLARGEVVEFLSPAALVRLITNLEEIKGTRTFVQPILAGKSFRTIIDQASEPEVGSILTAIDTSKQLADYVKSDLVKIIQHRHPHLFKKEADVIWTTKEALFKKKEELNRLLTVDLPQNRTDIGRARGFGDLSENYEYKAAKEREKQLYRKVQEIETALQKVKIIEPSRIETDQIAVGTRVHLKNLDTGELLVYTILGRWDIDIEHNVISDQAPIAINFLLGKKPGERLRLIDSLYEVVTIEKALQNY